MRSAMRASLAADGIVAPKSPAGLLFLQGVTDQQVADLDVLEVLETHPALEAGANLAHVFLLVAERGHLALKDKVGATVQADLGIAMQLAFGHAAAGDASEFGGGEDSQDSGAANDAFHDGGLEHAL